MRQLVPAALAYPVAVVSSADGKDNHPAGRKVAEQVIATFPDVMVSVRSA